MLIALLAILSVDLIVIAVLLVSVLSRKRWVKRQAGSFRGAIRLQRWIDGIPSKWGRGYGRWVRDVLVWTKAPFFSATSSSQPRPGSATSGSSR